MPCCEPYPGKTILFMSDWLYTAGVEREGEKQRDKYSEGRRGSSAHKNMAQNIRWFIAAYYILKNFYFKIRGVCQEHMIPFR